MLTYCGRCGAAVTEALPVEPLFSLPEAAVLIPLRERALRSAIQRHKDKLRPAIYRKRNGRSLSRVRFLYAADIVTLRSIYFTNAVNPKPTDNPVA